MNASKETFRSRLRQYQRRERMTIWIGAAYAALIALMTTKVFDQSTAPWHLSAVIATCIVVGGFCLGKTRIVFEWRATQIERQVEDNEVKLTDQWPTDDPWPVGTDRLWSASIYLLALSGFLTVAVTWWPAIKLLLC